MDEKHKEDQVRRYFKGTAREARRQLREGFASRPDRRQDASRGQAQEDTGWDEPRERRAKRRRKRKPSQGPKPRLEPETTEALVVSVARQRVLVRLGSNEESLLAGLAPQLRDTPLVVGDRVLLRTGESPRVERLLPRRNLLSRPDVGNRHVERPIASNVDVGVIVAAHSSPPLRPGLIDRYLIALQRAGVAPLLCINKIDLCQGEAQQAELEAQLSDYRALELPIVFASAQGGVGTRELARHLAGKTAVLVGHSGVGKSSLLGALGAAEEDAIRGQVRAYDGRGRHTTSASSLQSLPGGLRLIDTPGVRAFGLWGIDASELSRCFPGLGSLPEACRFGDCRHRDEPGCAVLAAVAEGQLSASRHAAYLRLLEEICS